MNTQYTRRLTMIRRALGVGALCLVASFGVAHAEDFAIPSARPVVDGMSTDDVKVVSAAHPGSANLITPNDWTYKALKTLVKHGAITDTHGFTFDDSTSYTKDELMPLLDEVVEKREQMNDNDRQFALRIYQENMRDVMDYRIERDKKVTKERALTDEQIKEKMKKFKIDDSRVKTNGDVRIRYTGSKNGKSKADARVQTEMTFTL
ncbi:hypothetical protein DWZ94_02295 [Veillonella atypica]|uniref:hypothetical protein n=1 Tax=Veillonella atypica TaxID=39777 RepID=UPI000E4E7950|nr:hypothetical protein [Veillonella atypica]RHL92264.1 hypothetical protein DWZ94_02295 [Veillonella atypica]